MMTPSPSKADRFHPGPLIAAAGLLAAGAWSLTQHHAAATENSKPAAPPPVQVTTARVQRQDVPLYRDGIGTVAAFQSVTVKARVDGQLDKIAFTEGQDVKAGQLLARIDPRALTAQLGQAQAQKAKDNAQLANARADLTRYSRLIAEDAATQQQVDTQKALVAQLEAAVQNDNALIAYDQVQLSYTTITAPIAGRLGAKLVDVGNIVHATDTSGLVVINQVDPISVNFTLPEAAFQDVNRSLQGSTAPLKVEALSRGGDEVLGAGELTLLNNQIDTATGTVQLKARFANAQHKLWPGEYVNVRLSLGERSGALTVPAAVVQRGQQGTYAYLVKDDGTVQPQPVTVAQIQDGTAVIDQGLAAGDRVVVDGQYKLRPGARVAESTARGGRAASADPSASAVAGVKP